jgi:bifunctional non-homologous end joining protein LigD/DNA ligase-1
MLPLLDIINLSKWRQEDMDLFEKKSIKPMLIAEARSPFDSPDYLFELKLDGERCIAYLSQEGTDLRNKSNVKLNMHVPELNNIHLQTTEKVILDGELIIVKDGKPNFYEIQKRAIMSNSFKIQLQSVKLPASFVAFDILYYKDEAITDRPLMERKKILEEVLKENARISISRYIENTGTLFYELAEKNELEGIVGKRKDSKYYFDKRTKDWIKIKFLQDEDFVITGFIRKKSGITSIVLGQYNSEMELIYKGHVSMGMSREEFRTIVNLKRIPYPEFDFPADKGNEYATWIKPDLVCTVQFMPRTPSGSLRQAVFKGLRDDIKPQECMEVKS